MLAAEVGSAPAPWVGRWRWEGGDAELEITADGDRLPLRTRSPAGAIEERAAALGPWLAVEDPPNLRLYGLDDGGQRLTLLDDETFRFRRA